MTEQGERGALDRLVGWFEDRLGINYPLLRPVPLFAVNPLYWLGALTIVAFFIQGVTGVIMMLYYVPSPTQAYASTQYVFQSVYYGTFLETIHLYTAYAMIMLAFMHLMRGYFVSVHKKPRELMWIAGMLMGFVTLGFGFTGYLLPWSVVSKSATDVGLGMIDALPPPVASLISFLVVGAGGDATELLRFYDLHVLVLPAALLVLLTVKMYMLETHGIGEPEPGRPLTEKESKTVPIFPDITLYLLELAAIFGAGMLLVSALFPLTLAPAYTPQLAGQIAAQPDWYFLWVYQILKIKVFEGAGLTVALSLVGLVFIVLSLLPFLDKSPTRRFSRRPKFVTLGVIFVAELIVLAVWGLLTPGAVIQTDQAVLVLGGTALAVALVSLGAFKAYGARSASHLSSPPNTHRTLVRTSATVIALCSLGAFAIGSFLDASAKLMLFGFDPFRAVYLSLSVLGIALVCIATMFFIYKVELRSNTLKKRIRFFEAGLERNGHD